jgi:MFS family permease
MEDYSFHHKSTTGAVFLAVCGLYACIHLDRQILAILAESVKSDLHLPDRELGALTGTAFSIAYGLLGLYFGTLADRLDRLALVRRGAWVWSVSCICAALAPHYSFLVACRAGVAVGEAIATAAAISLLADLAGERYRARAAGVFLTAAFIGAGAAAILGGSIIELLHDRTALPGWRVALVVAGTPGIAGALFLRRFVDRTVTEPAVRSAAMPVGMGPAALVIASLCAVLLQMYLPAIGSVPGGVSVAAVVAVRWVNRLRCHDPAAYRATLGERAFRYFVLAFAAIMFVDSAASFWLLPFAQRHYGLSAALAGSRLGGLMIAGGMIGCLVGGWAADRWRRSLITGRVWTALLAVTAEGAAILLAVESNDYLTFSIAFGVFCFASGGWTATAAAIAFDIVPAVHRGTGAAEYFLVTTLLGPGLGPFLVGLGSDLSGSAGAALGWSCGLCLVSAAALIGLGALLQRRGELRGSQTGVGEHTPST